MFYCVYDPLTQTLTYANPGHHPPVLLRSSPPSSLLRLEALTPPVGLLPELAVNQRTVTLAPGDMVVILSDGLPDAQDEAGEDLGDERLVDALHGLPHSGAEEFARAVLEIVEGFSSG